MATRSHSADGAARQAGRSSRKPARRKLRCSFCGRHEEVVSKLLTGPRVTICDRCVGHCNDILEAEGTAPFADLRELSDAEILASLKSTRAAAESLQALLCERVDELRRREVSWASIGGALDISRQAAWERFS